MIRLFEKNTDTKDMPSRFPFIAHPSSGMSFCVVIINLSEQAQKLMIDKDGRCASGFTTKKMIHGWIELGGETVCRF